MKNKVITKKKNTSGRSRFTDRIGTGTPKGILPCSVKGSVAALLTATALTFILSVLLYNTPDPAAFITPAAFSVLYASAFLGGFIASKSNKKSAVLCGLTVGGILTFVLFAASLLIKAPSSFGFTASLILRSAIILCALAGSVVGVIKNSETSKNKKHKKR
jgi:putative membrane protein (TIGR04086 family)